MELASGGRAGPPGPAETNSARPAVAATTVQIIKPIGIAAVYKFKFAILGNHRDAEMGNFGGNYWLI